MIHFDLAFGRHWERVSSRREESIRGTIMNASSNLLGKVIAEIQHSSVFDDSKKTDFVQRLQQVENSALNILFVSQSAETKNAAIKAMFPTVTLEENNKNIIVELVNEKFTQIINNTMKGYSFDFQNIPPGKYYLRVIEDKNNNYEWDYYSIKKKIDSERITYYPELIEVLSNWTIEDLLFDVEESVEKMFE